MPYHWTDTARSKTLRLWPYQSMTAPGFVWFMGSTATLLSLPLFAVLGSAVAWVLLLFFLAAIWGVWHAIMANQADRRMYEKLNISGNRIHLEHVPPRGPALTWEASPEWVTVHLNDKGPVEKYLTLRGGGREVELGAFLTPDERQGLYDDLKTRIRKC